MAPARRLETSAAVVLETSAAVVASEIPEYSGHRYWTKRLKFPPKCVGTFGQLTAHDHIFSVKPGNSEHIFSVIPGNSDATRNVKKQGVCTIFTVDSYRHDDFMSPTKKWWKI